MDITKTKPWSHKLILLKFETIAEPRQTTWRQLVQPIFFYLTKEICVRAVNMNVKRSEFVTEYKRFHFDG